MFPSIVLKSIMKSKIISVVKETCLIINNISDSWAITGGCNVFIRGCSSTADDIDIITTRFGASLIFEAMKNYVTRDLYYSEVKKLKSYFFEALVDGVKIEVMGDPENKINEKWVKNTLWFKAIEYLTIDETPIPLTTLDYELNINRILNNQERVNAIENCDRDRYRPS